MRLPMGHASLALVALCCCMLSSPALCASSSGRRLLACAQSKPLYAPPGERRSLPLCATQFFPSAEAPAEDRNSWQAVTVDKPHPLSRATAADLAASWARDPVNPRTDTAMQCSGEVDATAKECWAGRGVEVGATFTSISCCSTALVCYIKSGGCVMR